MDDRIHDWRADIGVRLGAAALLAIAFVTLRLLIRLHLPPPPASPGWIAFALAAIAFLSACTGAAMLVLGRHLFDRVEVSERWRPTTPPARQEPRD